jgi:hypothetical protein
MSHVLEWQHGKHTVTGCSRTKNLQINLKRKVSMKNLYTESFQNDVRLPLLLSACMAGMPPSLADKEKSRVAVDIPRTMNTCVHL